MAKPKIKVLVEVIKNPVEPIRIWIDNAKAHLSDIASVEGVSNIWHDKQNSIKIMIDKRYDVDEIAQELRELLTAEVPDIFRDKS